MISRWRRKTPHPWRVNRSGMPLMKEARERYMMFVLIAAAALATILLLMYLPS